MDYKLIDGYLKAQSKILYTLIMFGVVCLLVLSFTVRADTFTDLYDDPYNLLSGTGKTEDTGKIIDCIRPEWQITQTGAEELLNVDYYPVESNCSLTTFCIEAPELIKYATELSKTGKSISDIPITTTGNVEISKSKLSFDVQTKQCFNVTYNDREASLKIGFNSILIKTQAFAATFDSGSNGRRIIRVNSTTMMMSFLNPSNMGEYAITYDNGQTWTIYTRTITAGIQNLIVYPNNTVLGYGDDGIDLFGSYANSSLKFPQTRFVIANLTGNIDYASCVLDGNNIVHCCFIDTTNDALYYMNNSLGWNTSIVAVNTNTLNDSDDCDINIDSTNTPFIASTGTDFDDVRLWSPKIDGWGDNNGMVVFASTSAVYPIIKISDNDVIYVSYYVSAASAPSISISNGSNSYRFPFRLGSAPNDITDESIITDMAIWTESTGNERLYATMNNITSPAGQLFANMYIYNVTNISYNTQNGTDIEGWIPSLPNSQKTIGSIREFLYSKYPSNNNINLTTNTNLSYIFYNSSGVFYDTLDLSMYLPASDTIKPSFSTIPYNSTTTNQSATITWTPSESANYTLRYTTTADYTGGTLISNTTSSASQRDVGIYPLVNYTSYYINVSIWDTSGNYNQSNFSFRTNQNVANSCATCNILCSDNCVLTTNINCAAGAATVSGAGTLTGLRYLTNWQTLTINGGCVVQY